MIPESPIQALPQGWEDSPLSGVCLKVTKIDPLDLGRDDFKYIDIGSIESSTNSVERPQLLKIGDAPSRARQHVHAGDSVFSTVRPYLKNIAYIDESLDGEVASTGFCVLRPNQNRVLPRFLHFFAISDCLLEQVLPLQRGVSYPAVRDNEVFAARVGVPPLDEQEQIVEILEEQLSHLDAATAAIAAARTMADRFRRSLANSMFGGVSRDDDTLNDELKADWRWVEIGALLEDIQPGFASGKHNSDGHGVVHVRPMNVSRKGRLDFSDVRFVEDVSGHRLKRGDVLFNNTNSPALVGKTAFVDSDDNLAFSNHMTRLRVDPTLVDSEFMAFRLHALWQDGFFQEICSNHVNQASVSSKRLKQVEICLPPLAEQLEIVEGMRASLEGLERTSESVMTIEDAIGSMRRSLLQAAFCGNLTKEWREARNG
jgi:type I restriction enzyme S subunit